MKRPFGVTLLGVLLLLQGVLLLLVGLLVLILATANGAAVLPPGLGHAVAELTGGAPLSGAVDSVIGACSLASGIGMLRLRPWAWFAAMTLQGVTLTALLADALRGGENPPNMLLAAVIVLYLNTRSVRDQFRMGQQRREPHSAARAAEQQRRPSHTPAPAATLPTMPTMRARGGTSSTPERRGDLEKGEAHVTS
jgi:hypothetical protein